MKRIVSLFFACSLLFSASICLAMGSYPTTPPNLDITTGTTTNTQQTQQDLANMQNMFTMLGNMMKSQQDISQGIAQNLR
ncbi:MAG: hypothetical protein HY795_06680 [Desulfovibrio sp.]|nr:hypothetical protein [Desulfovibrio sp.]MBI4961215.1 hypothetical protein [Desulfovibrio sp.]